MLVLLQEVIIIFDGVVKTYVFLTRGATYTFDLSDGI